MVYCIVKHILFSCPVRITGEPDAEITWYKDEKKIKPKKTDQRVKIDWDMTEDVTTLSIYGVSVEDAGDYLVKATTKDGTVSELVTVTVNKPVAQNVMQHTVETSETVEAAMDQPKEETATESEAVGPKFEIAPEATSVDIGETLTLKCKVAGENEPPPPTIPQAIGNQLSGL